MRKRNIQKKFFLSEQENFELKEKAKSCGLPESTLIRVLINGFRPKQKPDEEFYKVMRAIYAISNNLNQLTVKSHSYDYIDTEELKVMLNQIGEFINVIQKKYLVPDEGD